MVMECCRDDVQHFSFFLHSASDPEQPGAEQSGTVALCNFLPYDQVEITRFVLEGHEDHARGARRPLPGDYDSRCIHPCAARERTHLPGGQDTHAIQSASEQCERMTAQSK